MNDLISWLRQQLDTDEAAALAAMPIQWSASAITDAGPELLAEDRRAGVPGYDYARALRQVQAHRAILDIHAIVWRDIGWLDHEREYRYGEVPVCGHCVQKHSHFQSWDEVPEGACATVKALVSIYSDRDGYRAEWSA